MLLKGWEPKAVSFKLSMLPEFLISLITNIAELTKI